MYKVITLSGKAGVGKDRLLHEVLKELPELNPIVSCTTRPPRENEVHGKDYFFLTHEEFSERLNDGRMVEATVFRDWCYGTSVEQLKEDAINIGVYNPEGVSILASMPGVKVCPFLIYASDKTRLLRQLNRETDPDVKEIVRRYGADEIDFSPENLLEIEFAHILDNDGHFSIWQLTQELTYMINHIDWSDAPQD